jgi:aminoglycoside phosphotransferase (APT) family kinase protein
VPVPIPEPVAEGTPAEGYPWTWSVYRWLDGTPALDAEVDHLALALDLAAFIRALQAVEVPDSPLPGSRGVPLAERDEPIREQIPRIADEFDPSRVLGVWEHALAAPVWDGPPVWLHGDLMPTNLLIRRRRLAGIVDWGSCTTGDPACEALTAWMSLTPEARPVFRRELELDDAAWARGRGWALSCAVMALPYYRETYPDFAQLARRTLATVLADDLE